MKIGYQGIDGAYSSIAARKLSPDSEYIGYPDFYSCFNELSNDNIDAMVLPLENSYAGRVSDVHRLIKDFELFFHAEFIMKIEHQLLVKKDTQLDEIEEIFSHEQAVMQCEKTLKKFFADKYNRNITISKFHDTAMAAELAASSSRKIAAIASTRAAEIFDLKIGLANINDDPDNHTHFVLLSKNPKYNPKLPDKKYITAFIFEVGNEYGSLSEVLNILSKNKISLAKIESYIPGCIKSDSAKFFVSCESHIDDQTWVDSMIEVNKICKYIHIFGCFEGDAIRF
jgi:prephenate dehydratase